METVNAFNSEVIIDGFDHLSFLAKCVSMRYPKL